MLKSSDKVEHFAASDVCPDGYTLSLNEHACVLPGEKYPPCLSTQRHADGACRYKLDPDTNPPSGWYINHKHTGIKKY